MPTVRYTTLNGRVIAAKVGGTRYHLSADPLGSTVALYTAGAVKADSFTYTAYGELKSGGTSVVPFTFVGTLGYRRDTVNRHYVRARNYRADHGRWMSVDPLMIESKASASAACAYCYAMANPMLVVDPSGLSPQPEKRHWDCLLDELLKGKTIYYACTHCMPGGLSNDICRQYGTGTTNFTLSDTDIAILTQLRDKHCSGTTSPACCCNGMATVAGAFINVSARDSFNAAKCEKNCTEAIQNADSRELHGGDILIGFYACLTGTTPTSIGISLKLLYDYLKKRGWLRR